MPDARGVMISISAAAATVFASALSHFSLTDLITKVRNDSSWKAKLDEALAMSARAVSERPWRPEKVRRIMSSGLSLTYRSSVCPESQYQKYFGESAKVRNLRGHPYMEFPVGGDRTATEKVFIFEYDYRSPLPLFEFKVTTGGEHENEWMNPDTHFYSTQGKDILTFAAQSDANEFRMSDWTPEMPSVRSHYEKLGRPQDYDRSDPYAGADYPLPGSDATPHTPSSVPASMPSTPGVSHSPARSNSTVSDYTTKRSTCITVVLFLICLVVSRYHPLSVYHLALTPMGITCGRGGGIRWWPSVVRDRCALIHQLG